MKRHTSDVKLVPASFFCDDCLLKDPRSAQDRTTIDFSEAKEEESDCYYCNLSGMPRPAEVLFNGFPSCRECRRRRNVMNFVAKTNENNQKVIVTQVSLNKDAAFTTYHKPHESTPTSKRHMDPRFASQDFQLTRQGTGMTTPRAHNPNFSLAIPYGLSTTQPPINSTPRTRKHTVADPSALSSRKNNMTQPIPVNISADEIRYEGQGFKFPIVRSDSQNISESGAFQQGPWPNTTRHNDKSFDRSLTLQQPTGGVDIVKVLKTPNTSLQKPQVTMSDPKVAEFFRKMSESGIQSLKSQLLFSTNADGFSGRKFHQRCDKKSPIILMIVLENGFKLGGFTYKGIDPKSVEVTDQLCGLFCTYDCKKIDFYAVGHNKVVYQPFGVAFGSPINLNINLESLSTFVCQLELGYYDPNGNRVLFSFDEKVDWEKFIKEFVVYTLK